VAGASEVGSGWRERWKPGKAGTRTNVVGDGSWIRLGVLDVETLRRVMRCPSRWVPRRPGQGRQPEGGYRRCGAVRCRSRGSGHARRALATSRAATTVVIASSTSVNPRDDWARAVDMLTINRWLRISLCKLQC
jgi:hypothetical protein